MTDTTTDSVNQEETEVKVDDRDDVIQDLKRQLDAVKGKADELLNETKKAKAKAREEVEAKERAETDKARKQGDFEQLLKSSEKAREELEQRLGSLRDNIGREKTTTTALKIASELADGSNAELLSEFISRRLKHTDDGVKVLDGNGELTVSSITDLKKEFESSDKFKSLLRGNRSTGGGAAGDGGRAAGVNNITRTSFDSLNPKQKMDFIKEGGKITD